MVLNEFFAALASGRILLALICCVGGGIMIGGSVRSIGGRFGWSLVMVVVVVGLLFTSEHVRTLVRAGESGSLPSGFFDDFVFLTVAICAALYFGSMVVAAYGVALQESDERAAVEEMGPDELLRELNVASALPVLANGWFAENWKGLTAEERCSWVEQHIEQLRELRLAGGDNGSAGFGANLAFYVAQIDEYGSD